MLFYINSYVVFEKKICVFLPLDIFLFGTVQVDHLSIKNVSNNNIASGTKAHYLQLNLNNKNRNIINDSSLTHD